ncbi:MAG: YihY/virulence factor BrkB family protein [Hyphomicrobiales bacterium]
MPTNATHDDPAKGARGRQAETPTNIPPRGWLDIGLRVWVKIGEDNLTLIAAGIAFLVLLALFPGITALVALGGLVFLDPDRIVEQFSDVVRLLPEDAREILIDQAESVARTGTDDLGLVALFGLGLALFSATKGVGSLIGGLNVVYDEREKRGFLHLFALKLGLTLLLMFGVLIGFVMAALLPATLSLVQLGSLVEIGVSVVGWTLLVVFVLVALALLFRFGPSRRQARWQWLSVGSIAAAIIWLIASAGFAFFTANFASYNQSFGSLTGVVVLLLWLWISAFVVLMGAAVNAEMEAQTRVDSTIGEPRPMGERGATKADELGEAFG